MLVKEQSFTNKEPKTIVINAVCRTESGNFYLNRPLKLIELTNGKRHFGA
jgi:hypothetical protein